MKHKKLKSLKVLLVEDETNIAKLLKSAIGDEFRSFLIANDGVEGFEIYQKISPDIIISDIMMPNLTGLEMAQKIRKENKHVPILLLSAFSEKEKLLNAIDIGITKYFLKPYCPKEILDYIYSILDQFDEKIVSIDSLFRFNKNTLSLYKNKTFVPLTSKEVKFIYELLDAEEKILSYEAIKNILWETQDVSDERLRTFVKRLRQKTSKTFVKTVKSVGYRL